MKVFILDLDNFDSKTLEKLIKEDINVFKYKAELKRNQHIAGRFLLKFAAEKFYGITDTSITYDAKKPIFKNSPLHFSISHSRNMIAVVIAQKPVGIDIEYNLADRDFVSILERCDIAFESNIEKMNVDLQKKMFYESWTKYEAKIKLNAKTDVFYSTVYPVKHFTLSVAYKEPFFIEELINCNDILTI